MYNFFLMNKRYAALHSRDYRLLFIGQGISLIGTQMQLVALNWQIYLLTNSAVALGLIGLARFVPIVVFSLIGGTVADAHNRKRILFITQSLLAVFSLLLALITFNGIVTPLMIFVLTALSAATVSFDTPARQALIPSLVKREDLANAMSLNSIMFQTSAVVGPALGGIVIAQLGVGNVYLFNAFSFIAVIVALVLMHANGEIQTKEKVEVSVGAILDGLHFVRKRTLIWSTMLLDFFSTFFASATALLPIYAKDILQVGSAGYGFLNSAISIGAVVAGLVIAHKGKMSHQGVILLGAVGFFGLATVIFGLSNIYILSLIALFIVGAGDGISTIIRNTIRQVATPDHIRGRMTSINMIFFMGGPQLGEFEAGILAAALGAPASVVIGGVATMIVVGIVAVTVPTLRKYQGHEVIE